MDGHFIFEVFLEFKEAKAYVSLFTLNLRGIFFYQSMKFISKTNKVILRCCCCCCRPHSTNVLPAESSTRIMWQPTVSPPRWQGKAPLCRDSSRGPGKKGRLVGICTQISGRMCDRASGRVGKMVRAVVDLQWKRDMRQGVVTCLCE